MLLIMKLDPANVDTDGLADDLTGEGPWGESDFEATAVPDGLAHQLSITSGDDLDEINFTLVGTDADDNEISETIAGPDNGTVETTKYFKTLTSITASATVGEDTFDVGWVDEFVSPTIQLNWRLNVPSHWLWSESGTLEADIEFTVADPGRFAEQADIPWSLPVSGLDDVQNGEYWEAPAGLVAARVKFNSYTDTAEATVYASQAEVPA